MGLYYYHSHISSPGDIMTRHFVPLGKSGQSEGCMYLDRLLWVCTTITLISRVLVIMTRQFVPLSEPGQSEGCMYLDRLLWACTTITLISQVLVI